MMRFTVPVLLTLTLFAAPLASAQAAAAPSVGRTALSARERQNRDVVLRFYDRVFDHKDLSVVPEMMTENYIQHNPSVPSGRAAFIKAFGGFFKAFPQVSNEIKSVMVDGDYVILHSLSKVNPQDRGSAVVDIFRLENGKLAEHWDVAQAIPEKSANTNTMF